MHAARFTGSSQEAASAAMLSGDLAAMLFSWLDEEHRG
jgi:hypothetical protein